MDHFRRRSGTPLSWLFTVIAGGAHERGTAGGSAQRSPLRLTALLRQTARGSKGLGVPLRSGGKGQRPMQATRMTETRQSQNEEAPRSEDRRASRDHRPPSGVRDYGRVMVRRARPRGLNAPIPKFSKHEKPMVRAFGSSALRTVSSVRTGIRPNISGSQQT